MKKSILIIAILISGLLSAQASYVAGVQTNATGKVADAPSVYKINQLSQITGDQSAHAGQTWVLEDDIDCLGGDIDLSGYNITLKDGGGLFTNFNSFNLGDFRTDGNPNATYFDQSGSVDGYCLDGKSYLKWFGSVDNGDLMDNTISPLIDPTGVSTVNGATPNHIAFQNCHNVAKDSDNNWGEIHYYKGVFMVGDGTNPEYTGVTAKPDYLGGTCYVNGTVTNSSTIPIDNIVTVDVNNWIGRIIDDIDSDGIGIGVTVVSYSSPNLVLSEAVTLDDNTKLQIAGQYISATGAINIAVTGSTGEIGTMQGFEFYGEHSFNDEIYPPIYNEGPKIFGHGAELICHPRQSNTEDNKGYEFYSLKNIYIDNLTYDGNNIQRDPYWIMSGSINRQDAFSFFLTKDTHLVNVEAKNSVHDGFAFGGKKYTNNRLWGENGVMDNCRSFGSYRTGMGIVNHKYLRVTNGSDFSNTGQNTSLTDGRHIAESTMMGIDAEQGFTATDTDERGQEGLIIDNVFFRNNLGSALGLHWGTYHAKVTNSYFEDNGIFEPADGEGLGGNNIIENCIFRNAGIIMQSGGAHILRNNFLFNKILTNPTQSANREVTSAAISVSDSKDNYLGNDYNDGTNYPRVIKAGRKALIKDNTITVYALDDRIPVLDISLGKIDVNHGGAVVEGNVFVDAIGVESGGGDNTIATIGSLENPARVENNVWHFRPSTLVKFNANIGRLNISAYNYTYDKNKVFDGYNSVAGYNVQSNNSGANSRGGHVIFSGLQQQVDGDEAIEVFVPQIDGILNIKVVGGDDLGDSYLVQQFSTSDPTYRKTLESYGATESIWMFADPVTSTNPRTGNACYKIDIAHDISGNTNTETQVVCEWISQKGDGFDEGEFFVLRNTSYGGGTFRRVYDGGKQGNTASIPTTGGVGNYTEIKEGAKYYNTETHIEMYHNGTSFVNP